MLGAAGVQIPENNLDNLHSSREEDGTLEFMDLQDLMGSFLLAGLGLSVSIAIDFLEGTLVVVVILVKRARISYYSEGCDLLALVDDFTPVEDNTGLLETRFDEEALFMIVFPEGLTGSVNPTLLFLFFGVTANNSALELLKLGQEWDLKNSQNFEIKRLVQ
nr:hypothetical protein [Tanacetum cinerariifolium]